MELHKSKPINKLNKYIIDYINKNTNEKGYFNDTNKLFLTLLDMPEFVNEIFYVKDKLNYDNIDKLIKKFGIIFTSTYDYESLNRYFTQIFN